jgi:hypothetical protein
MVEIEFGLRKCMTGVFVDVDDKFFRDGGKFRIWGVRSVSKWNKLESVTSYFVSYYYVICDELTRESYIIDNTDGSGTYNCTIDRQIVGVPKSNVVIDKDKQVAFVIAAARVIGNLRITTRG